MPLSNLIGRRGLEVKLRNLELEYEKSSWVRVSYNSLSNKIIVYMDAKRFKKSIAKQIAIFFELNFDDVIWKKDPHYKT